MVSVWKHQVFGVGEYREELGTELLLSSEPGAEVWAARPDDQRIPGGRAEMVTGALGNSISVQN